jgi:ribosome-associated heat shock protein Hsp15
MAHRKAVHDPVPDDANARQRLDKWLWCARFFKTRTLATSAIESGKVRVAGERVKPAREIGVGDRIEVERDGLRWQVEVLGLATRRGPASEAAQLYLEGEASRLAREEMIALRRAADAANPDLKGRPTKRMRRVLERLLKESQGGH